MQIKKLAVVAGTVGALALTLLTAAPASADYAPGPDDVVGVGSDTVQYAIDFLADGDYTGSTGYNLGQRNRIINFDATPDANARLAYGAGGLNGATAALSVCAGDLLLWSFGESFSAERSSAASCCKCR